MNDWYVYKHIRLYKKLVFYIGIGNKKNSEELMNLRSPKEVNFGDEFMKKQK
jgi:hypothetical protein